jgi:Ca2+-binding EF-hand superfamily protein
LKHKEVYEKIFPLGDASKYAHLVFRAIDRDRTGGITFGDFMEFLSVISKGTEEEKMMWSFQFYDVNQDGTISRDEMLKVSQQEIFLKGLSHKIISTSAFFS